MNNTNIKWDLPYTKSKQDASRQIKARNKGAHKTRTGIKLLGSALPLICSVFATDLMANSGGIIGHSKQNNTCSNCHTGDRFNSRVSIEGAETVDPGSLNEFVINLTHDGNRGGFNMSASDGSLETGSGMRKQNGELTHNFPQNVSGGGNTWTIEWQAPSEAGTQTLFVCANAVNGDGTNNGDETITACNTLDVVVGSLNETPQANNDSATVDEDSSVTISVLSNDTDSDGSLDASTVTIVSNVSSGSTTVNSGGTVAYTPASNFNGSDSFTYTVADNEGAVSEAATVSITVNSVNDVPVAANDSASTSEDTSITIDVLANDSDVEDTLTGSSISIQSGPDNGSASVVGNNVSYTPDDNFSGSDSFTYRVTDPDGGSSEDAMVSITVVAVNDAPDANDDTASTDEDNAIVIDVLANDSDSDGTLDSSSLQIVSMPSSGSASVSAGLVTYTPVSNFNGSDSFTYRVDDNEGSASNIANVSVTVNSVNDAPVAADDIQGTNIDTSVQISVLENDSDDGNLDPASIVIVMSPSNGSALADSNGVITYTPENGFVGQDSFTYTVSDTEGLSSNEATVSVSVRVNEVPVANADSAETDEDQSVTITVLANDTDDIEIDVSSVQIVSTPENGTATVASNGEINYQPASNFFGNDTFSYTVGDFENGTSEAAVVSVSVNAVNDTPVFTSEPGLSLVQGQTFSYQISVSDVDSEELTVSIVQAPAWLTLDDLNLSGVPPLSAIGNNDVVLQVSDGDASDEQSFTILVSERTDADLTVSATTATAAGIVGESFVYQITVTSNGPADASDVSLSVSWEGLTGDFALPDACSANGSTVNCVIDLVTPDSPASLNIGFIADSFGDVVTTASVDFADENDDSNNQTQIARSVARTLSQPVAISDDTGASVAAVADLNGDGFMDLASSSRDFSELTIYLNNGRGQLMLDSVTAVGGTVSMLKFAQLDDDAEVELLLVRSGSQLVVMDASDGISFSESSSMSFADISDLAVADFNNDGAMDIAVAQSSASNIVLQNDGSGAFVEETLGSDGSLAVAALDINGDMTSELVFANGSSANTLYMNQSMEGAVSEDGSITWFDAGATLSSENSLDVVVIDVDGDMQYEVLFANAGISGNTLYQVVEGTLQQSAVFGRAATKAALVADLDGDGSSDLIFVQPEGALQQWLNDGSGGLELAADAMLLEDASGFAVADFNADGVSDLAVTASDENVVFNDNSGSFAPATIDLSINAELSVDVVSVGDSWSYTVSASNNSGSFDAVGAAITLSVPESLGASNLTDFCGFTDGVWRCATDALTAGGSISFTVEGVIAEGASGELSINAQVDNVVTDSDASNNIVQLSLVVNAAPVANNDSVVVDHNQTATINVLANDSDDNAVDATSVVIVAGPSNGTASVSGSGSITYTPTTDYSGSDSLTYQMSDTNGVVSNVATVSITVNEAPSDDGGAINYLLTLTMLLLVGMRRRAGGLGSSVPGRSAKKRCVPVCKG